jgi:hypothetical protein
VRIVLRAATPDVDEVVVRDLSEPEADVKPTLHPMDWRVPLSLSMSTFFLLTPQVGRY